MVETEERKIKARKEAAKKEHDRLASDKSSKAKEKSVPAEKTQ